MKKMSITFLLPNSGIGGGVRAIMEFANGLLRLKHHVRILYRSESNKNNAKRIIQRYIYGKPINWLDYFKGEAAQYEKLSEHNFKSGDIVVSMCSQTTFDSQVLSSDVIRVFHCHGAEYENWDSFINAINQPVEIIAISSHVKNIIEKYSTKKNIDVVPNGIDSSEYYRDDSIDKIGIGGCIRWRHSKDPVTTTKVFEHLLKDLPSTPLYSFGIGKKPTLASKLNYYNNPTPNKAREIYNKSKIWFLSSIEEGFGLTVLEAMACGCIVVTTECGGPQDIVVDGINGFNVEIGNYGGIVHKCKKLIHNPDLCAEMSKAAIETTKKYSWDKSAAALEAVLLNFTGGKDC